ncbi:MBL fold metallo-hydrolase [Pseudomonas sp. MHK4]
MHHDHAGGLNHFPHTPIIVTKENFLLANSFKGAIFGCLPQYFPRWLAPTLIEFKNESFGPFQQTYPLTKDKRILLVPTPGHMRGHMSVIVRTSDVTYFLSGDARFSGGGECAVIDQGIPTRASDAPEHLDDPRAAVTR